MNKAIRNYAKSLIKHGLYSSIDEALTESIRWHKKQELGLEEPLKCPHHHDIETTITHTENGGMIVEYSSAKQNLVFKNDQLINDLKTQINEKT